MDEKILEKISDEIYNKMPFDVSGILVDRFGAFAVSGQDVDSYKLMDKTKHLTDLTFLINVSFIADYSESENLIRVIENKESLSVIPTSKNEETLSFIYENKETLSDDYVSHFMEGFTLDFNFYIE